jgi:hypothetical protein
VTFQSPRSLGDGHLDPLLALSQARTTCARIRERGVPICDNRVEPPAPIASPAAWSQAELSCVAETVPPRIVQRVRHRVPRARWRVRAVG